ncbi:MAG: single-stranded-DNA-specific exonuclease RecJ, partial [Chloroflexi bacterium]|nr:single-stranded-DNA-specific exonuclease RecJ [Chloroflexota bacterium]
MSHKRWVLAAPQRATPTSLQPLEPLAAQVLANRGVTGDWEAFLAASSSLVWDPYLLPEMGLVVTRLRWAIRQEQPIAIYGDFDVDGITGTALLAQGLSRLGARVVPYIPHRFDEGYGLNVKALERLHHQGVRLVVTVDTGTTAHEEVAWAQAHGLDLIITDHHLPGPTLPPALATVNPRRSDSLYPFPQLAGVGVALKVLQALGREDTDLDLVALGTVADMVPLLGENRYLVQQGLSALNRSPRIGIISLMAEAGLSPGQVDTEAVSFGLAPRLNAAGRMAHARLSYALLTTSSRAEAREQAVALEAYNRERQRRTEEVYQRARQMLSDLPGEVSPLIMLGDPAFDAGVVGIAASRLAEEFYRPTILFHLGTEVCKGSARSIPEFNVAAALAQCRPWLLRFGGHPQAAGFTARGEDIPAIQRRLEEIAAQELASVDLRPCLHVDAQVNLAELSGGFLRFLHRLAPFGPGNPEPAFLSRNVAIVEARPLGNGRHLRLKLRQGHALWDAIAFGLGAYHGTPSGPLDVVYTLGVNSWQGEDFLELRLLDFAPAGTIP